MEFDGTQDDIVTSGPAAVTRGWTTLTGALVALVALFATSLTISSPAGADEIVIVEAGDSLSEIAAEYGTSVSRNR